MQRNSEKRLEARIHNWPEAREKLLAKRAELMEQLRPAPVGPERVGDEDQARVLHDQFISARLQRIAYDQIKLIDAALARMESGEYGVCIDCESKIPPRRLAAIPWANRCVKCQELAMSQEEPDEYTGRAA